MFFFTEYEINDIFPEGVTAWFMLLEPPRALPLPPWPVQWLGITLGTCENMCLTIRRRGRGLWRSREPPLDLRGDGGANHLGRAGIRSGRWIWRI